MSLPAPNLDDRGFQDLVDDAKRMVQRRCPAWTDHNVSDPGVTLIETFAFMVDQLVYRLNRVPDRLHVKFLDLIGLHLLPPAAARTGVTFWLSAPQEGSILLPAGTEVSTERPPNGEAVTFTTVADLAIVPCRLEALASVVAGGEAIELDPEGAGVALAPFGEPPTPGDVLLVGLDDATPSCAVGIRVDCDAEGVGVDPEDPPIVWEAWNGAGWSRCDVERDGTGGFNRPGDVVVHVPATHTTSVVARKRAGWLRCRVVGVRSGQPAYTRSPRIRAVEAWTIGGTVEALHATPVDDEILGLSEEVPGQRFPLAHRPVVAGDDLVLEVAAGAGWQPWTRVQSFAGSGPEDRHFVLDASAGEVILGPAVRDPDGELRRCGAVPPRGAPLRVRQYRYGGGRSGNVAAGALQVLHTPVAYVTSVANRRPATGGADGETVEEAKRRGPMLLNTRDRAVTAGDHEHLALQAAPGAGRVRCVPAAEGPGAVRLLVVPAVDAERPLALPDLTPPEAMLDAIRRALEDRRLVGSRIVVEPPTYQAITVVARVRTDGRADPQRVRADALAALHRYYHPIEGGPAGEGWPFGRPVHVGEVHGVLGAVPGLAFVEEARLFPADAVGHHRGEPVERIDIDPHCLVFSYEHQVQVEAG